MQSVVMTNEAKQHPGGDALRHQRDFAIRVTDLHDDSN
jgi:hypothetical protein